MTLSSTEKVAKIIGILASQTGNTEALTQLTKAVHELTLEKYKEGVQSGYRKLLSDHRAGYIDLSSTPQKVIDRFIENHTIQIKPSEVFGDG